MKKYSSKSISVSHSIKNRIIYYFLLNLFLLFILFYLFFNYYYVNYLVFLGALLVVFFTDLPFFESCSTADVVCCCC